MRYLFATSVGASEFAVPVYSQHVVTIKTNAERFVQTAKSAVLNVVVDVVVSVGLISFLSSCRIWNINYSEH